MAAIEPEGKGVSRCEWCSAPAPDGSAECEACGGPVRLIKPSVIECGWCGKPNRRDETAVCRHCSGPLPLIPGSKKGPRPPDPPRTIPKGYRARLLVWKNKNTILGIVFTIVLIWSLVFPIVGIILWVYGHRKAKRVLSAIERGEATRGRLLEVAVGAAKRLGGRRPWKVTIEYETKGGVRLAELEAFDPSHEHRAPGEHLWVLYLPETPDAYSIWPPLH